MTKAEKKQVDRAAVMGRGALLRTLAVIHRAGSSRTQREVIAMLEQAHALNEFETVNGALLHRSEV